jgi:flagellar biosynthesis protein FlhB
VAEPGAMSEKTEEATPRKLRKAREEGDSPVSAALVQGFAFVAALALAPAALGAASARAAALLRSSLEQTPRPISAIQVALDVAALSLPLLFVAAAAAAAAGFAQTGGAVALKKLAPDLKRANPFTGLKNLLSWQRVIGIVRALAAALIVGWLAVRLVLDHMGNLTNTIGSLSAAVAVAGDLVRRLGWIAALVGLSLAMVDVLVTRRAWFKRQRMTKDEVKREYKESEGDPELKAARKRAHQEVLAGSMIAAVKQANLVIVNPTHLATALKYEQDEDEAPRVVAQGQGDLARSMIEAARAYGVPVIRDVPVARALSELEIGDEIPEQLYEAVAEILREAWESEAQETT